MYAIVQFGSFQYRVSEGDTIETQRVESKEGMDIILDKVLLVANDGSIRIGQPYLSDVKVTAKVIRHHLAAKAVSFKYRRRKDSAWKKGHRQRMTTLKIAAIKTA